MTAYSCLKVAHLVAIAVWIGSMLTTDLALLAIPTGAPPPAMRAMQRWHRLVALPALLATWAAGIAMAVWVGWWHEGWVWAKAALVLALSALFAAQAASLHRLQRGVRPWRWMQFSPLITIVALMVIATLAVGKPF